MGEDTIYFTTDFKSYDITRGVSRAEIWYDWTERGRNMITRMSISQKTMEWLVYALKEASKGQGNSVRRWKFLDHFTEFFYSRNFNKNGRYISILKMQRKRRGVIIIPEWSLNSGWPDITTKITNFINAKVHKAVKILPRKTEEGLLFSETIRNIKWTTREINDAKVLQKGNSLIITKAITRNQSELLVRSVVGSLPEDITDVTLVGVRRWVSSTWIHNHGINIYEMGHNIFLFEFPTKTVADHIVRGEWFWKSSNFTMQWWSPTSNTIQEKLDQVWIRVVGLPLQFWSQKILLEIENLCGGWIQTKEETELRNHLKWARLKVKRDGECIPNSVELVHGGLTFKVHIWAEIPTRIISVDHREECPRNQRERTDHKGEERLLGFTKVSGHVGSSSDPKILNQPAAPARETEASFKVPLPEVKSLKQANKNGPKPFGTVYLNQPSM